MRTRPRQPTLTGQYASQSLDLIGASASLLCALHCAAVPLVFALVPLSGFSLYLADPRVEWLLVGLSLHVATASLTLGFRRHRSRRGLVLFVGAALILLTAGLGEELG